MRPIGAYARSVLFGTVAVGAIVAVTGMAQAGGLAVREQSTSSQGSSFAGSAAGYDLSSAFWNPAAFGIAGWGITTESHAALILPNGDVTGTLVPPPGMLPPCAALPCSADIGMLAFVPASYAAYRFNKDLVLGLSINSPFGLTTKPDPFIWQGGPVAQTSKVFTANVTPTLSYQIAPGLFIGAGVQLEYAKLTLRFMDSAVNPNSTASAEADDNLGVGYTAGILWQPSKSTSIGLGYRSTITHDLEGSFVSPGLALDRDIALKFETPEIATLSIRQAVAPHTRLLGTVEWTNWSRFDSIPIVGLAPAALEGHWHDSWLYAVGLEYDVNHKLTVRTGVAFEKSPIQNADERLLSVPDSDRWWLSGGLTYRWSEKLTFDFAYTHIFFDDAPIDRFNLSGTRHFIGEADQSADIVSVSMKTKW